MSKVKGDLANSFVNDIKQIIDQARISAVRSVDFHRVEMYWKMGKRIFNEEQQGKERAGYGTYLIKKLAVEIEPEYGSGFSYRQLERSRQFYRTYSIASALRTQLNWSQYRMLISIEDASKREYYELEAVNNGWTACNHFLLKYLSNLSIPSLIFSIEVAYENRIKPSPLLPKSIPGVMAILALVNASRQNW